MIDSPPSSTMPIRAAPSTIIYRGQPILRRKGFVVGPRIICPGGHAFKPRIFPDAIVEICREQIAPGRICGAAAYVLAIPARGPHKPAMLWYSHVDSSDITAIRTMTIEQILAYFGVSFESVEKTG